MKKRFFCYLLLLFFCSGVYCFAQETAPELPYPGLTLVWGSNVWSGVDLPFGMAGSKYQVGATFGIGTYIENWPFKGSRFDVRGKYSFQPLTEIESLMVPGFGIGWAWHFGLLGSVACSPRVGMDLVFPIAATVTGIPGANIALGADLELRIGKRDFIGLHPELSIPILAGSLKPSFSIGLSLRTGDAAIIPVENTETVLSHEPLLFSPDEDGENDVLNIGIVIKNPDLVKTWRVIILDPLRHVFHDWTGTGAPPNSIRWNGYASSGELVEAASDYTIRLEVTDVLGREMVKEDSLKIDILVIREGDRLKIRIPDIQFSPNSALLETVAVGYFLESNVATLARLVQIFSRFPNYTIIIEGHANLINWNDPIAAALEHRYELIPLSKVRAEAVKIALVKLGIDHDRILTLGMGGARPMVPNQDSMQNWKNRRVEILLKRGR